MDNKHMKLYCPFQMFESNTADEVKNRNIQLGLIFIDINEL